MRGLAVERIELETLRAAGERGNRLRQARAARVRQQRLLHHHRELTGEAQALEAHHLGPGRDLEIVGQGGGGAHDLGLEDLRGGRLAAGQAGGGEAEKGVQLVGLLFFTDEEALSIYRIVQEILNNMVKHSEAKNAVVEISHILGKIEFTNPQDRIEILMNHY